MVSHIREPELVEKISDIFAGGPYRLGDYSGTGGPGGVGALLENLLGLTANNIASPDAVEFEVKTTTGKNMLTLFHKEPEVGSVGDMNKVFSWPSTDGDESFRHTVRAAVSDRGFRVVVKRRSIQVAFDPAYVAPAHEGWLEEVQNRREGLDGESVWLKWTRDDLSRAISHKMPNCVLVHAHVTGGKGPNRLAKYYKMEVFKEILLSRLYRGLKRSIVAVDIDTSQPPGKALRNHGTKLRIRRGGMHSLYASVYTKP